MQTEIFKNRIVELCMKNEYELMEHLANFLQMFDYKPKTDKKGIHYLYAKGSKQCPILLIAHLDTVFSWQPEEFFYDKEKAVLWSPHGLGTDDRAGVFAIMELIRNGYRPSVLFTTGEEVGGTGAIQFSIDFPVCPFKGIKYMIELDRANSNDCVFYSCDNKEFESYIVGFDFQTQQGSFTDISILMPIWKIAGVNLSIGYSMEHTYAEHLKITDLMRTISKVGAMLDDAPSAKKYKYVQKIAPKLPPYCSGCYRPFRHQDVPHCYKDNITNEILTYCDECNAFIQQYQVE